MRVSQFSHCLVFSTENWKRDKKEVLAIMRLLEDYLKRERESFLKNNTRFVHSGRRDRIQKPCGAHRGHGSNDKGL